jgi:site-specific DNA-adenine methylase
MEIINDIDGEIVNLFQMIRDRRDDLIEVIRLTPLARQEYTDAFEECSDPLERARRTLIKSWMGRGGLLKAGFKIKRDNEKSIKAFNEFLPWEISVAADRLLSGGVQIECKDGIDIIKKYNSPRCLIYIDPPYPRYVRGKNKLYEHEYKNEDHERLLKTIKASTSNIIISSYENELGVVYKMSKEMGMKVKKTEVKTTFPVWVDGKRHETIKSAAESVSFMIGRTVETSWLKRRVQMQGMISLHGISVSVMDLEEIKQNDDWMILKEENEKRFYLNMLLKYMPGNEPINLGVCHARP